MSDNIGETPRWKQEAFAGRPIDTAKANLGLVMFLMETQNERFKAALERIIELAGDTEVGRVAAAALNEPLY